MHGENNPHSPYTHRKIDNFILQSTGKSSFQEGIGNFFNKLSLPDAMLLTPSELLDTLNHTSLNVPKKWQQYIFESDWTGSHRQSILSWIKLIKEMKLSKSA
jgi:hypothetical protein